MNDHKGRWNLSRIIIFLLFVFLVSSCGGSFNTSADNPAGSDNTDMTPDYSSASSTEQTEIFYESSSNDTEKHEQKKCELSVQNSILIDQEVFSLLENYFFNLINTADPDQLSFISQSVYNNWNKLAGGESGISIYNRWYRTEDKEYYICKQQYTVPQEGEKVYCHVLMVQRVDGSWRIEEDILADPDAEKKPLQVNAMINSVISDQRSKAPLSEEEIEALSERIEEFDLTIRNKALLLINPRDLEPVKGSIEGVYDEAWEIEFLSDYYAEASLFFSEGDFSLPDYVLMWTHPVQESNETIRALINMIYGKFIDGTNYLINRYEYDVRPLSNHNLEHFYPDAAHRFPRGIMSVKGDDGRDYVLELSSFRNLAYITEEASNTTYSGFYQIYRDFIIIVSDKGSSFIIYEEAGEFRLRQ